NLFLFFGADHDVAIGGVDILAAVPAQGRHPAVTHHVEIAAGVDTEFTQALIQLFRRECPLFGKPIKAQIFKPHKPSGDNADNQTRGNEFRRTVTLSGSAPEGREMLSDDFQQLHIKDQCRVRSDAATGTALTVGELVGNVQAPLGTHGHQLQRFGPAGDHTVYGKVDRLAAVLGRVEYSTVNQGAVVMGFYP